MKWIVVLGLCVSAFGQTGEELRRRSAAQQQAAAEKQRQAVRVQAQAAGATLLPEADPVEPAPTPVPPAVAASGACDPMTESDLTPLIQTAAQVNSLQPALIRAVIEQESGFRPCAVSPKGARGLMQLMPATAEQFTVADPFNPAQNIATGAKYLKQLLDRFHGDITLAVSAYNAGPAAVDQAGGVPGFPETRDYVKSVLQRAGIKQTAPPSNQTPRPIEN